MQVVFREGLTVQHILYIGRKVPVLYSNSEIIYNNVLNKFEVVSRSHTR